MTPSLRRWALLAAAAALLGGAAAVPAAAEGPSPGLAPLAPLVEAAVAARSPARDAADTPGAPLASPLTPLRVVNGARLPDRPWLEGHRGVDLAASAGEAVTSPAAGMVSFVGVVVDRPVITITHAGGLRSSLEPVDASVAVGDTVATGSPIGTVADTLGHCAPATCLHWGVREGETYLDPLDLLAGFGPVRLLDVS
ncbi:murein hydrolase activator EnvC [Demequina sp. NBRC 110057]|uniref:murein hydrolase activator EnvC family protein n=1 Tax=Demequina sp. NBRC 110057 TaxID=1570346 RepID=UPI000A018B84|nr:M23 family metallopeptidase [Demequina sp. NBRC 110057]